jgi:pimeloyl-ACP methyl ester carboxylesterase
MGGASSFWAPVAKSMPSSYERIMIDWPGLGPVPASDAVQCFDDLVRLARTHLDEPTAVVAQSMGGAVALRVALDPSAVVTHLVLCATSGGLDMTSLGATDWRPDYRKRWPEAPTWAFEPIGDVSEELSFLRVPTLLIWATNDPVSPVAVGQHLASILPMARLRLLEASDHMFASSHSGDVASLITEHLATP